MRFEKEKNSGHHAAGKIGSHLRQALHSHNRNPKLGIWVLRFRITLLAMCNRSK